MGDTILRVDDIQKFYGNKGNLTKAIDHISFSVRKGEFLGIMGASGSGKTTLLNCISTIDTVTSGHIYVEEKDITALHGAQLADFRGKKLGFIFQNFNLLDTLTAYENISLALSIAGTKPSEIEQRIPQIAQALNIQDVLGKFSPISSKITNENPSRKTARKIQFPFSSPYRENGAHPLQMCSVF